MEKKLKSLEEANSEKSLAYGNNPIIYNGIACPLCGQELLDCNPNMVLACYPPKIATICSDNENCSYRGTRTC